VGNDYQDNSEEQKVAGMLSTMNYG
jgi:hypothetical protein